MSILAARHEPIARRFADRGEDHLAGLPPTTATTSSPPCPAHWPHLDCTLDRHINAGNHVIVFGAVQRTCHRDGEPMAFLSGRFGDYTDRGHEPVDRFF